MLFRRDVGLLSEHVLVDHALGYLVLHLEQLGVHHDCVHANDDGLPRDPVKANIVVRAVVVLIVVEGAPRHE